MDLATVSLLRCPLHTHAGPLRRRPALGPPRELVCECGREFPVVDGIVDMLVDSRYDEAFRQAELEQWDSQADRYDEKRLQDLNYMAGIKSAVRRLDAQAGECILDAGCGTGLTTERWFGHRMRAVCLDLSRESLRSLRSKIGERHVLYVRGDLAALPFAPRVFDRVLCFNALQQIPDQALRRESVAQMARCVRARGRVVIGTQNYSIPKRLRGWVKVSPGTCYSGQLQYIYRYDAEELRELLASHLQVHAITAAGMPVYYGLKLSPLAHVAERVMAAMPALARWGNVLIGTCSAPERRSSGPATERRAGLTAR